MNNYLLGIVDVNNPDCVELIRKLIEDNKSKLFDENNEFYYGIWGFNSDIKIKNRKILVSQVPILPTNLNDPQHLYNELRRQLKVGIEFEEKNENNTSN